MIRMNLHHCLLSHLGGFLLYDHSLRWWLWVNDELHFVVALLVMFRGRFREWVRDLGALVFVRILEDLVEYQAQVLPFLEAFCDR